MEVVGKDNNKLPEQIGATAVKAGVGFGVTVIVKNCVVAQRPGVGVKV